jgi:hypothetical protein
VFGYCGLDLDWFSLYLLQFLVDRDEGFILFLLPFAVIAVICIVRGVPWLPYFLECAVALINKTNNIQNGK